MEGEFIPLQDYTTTRTEKIAYYFRYWKESFLSISIFGAIQFIVLTNIATFFYKGGSHFDFTNSGYSFAWNYISDLGRVYSISGELNIISHVLFTTSTTIAGLSIILFSTIILNHYKNTKIKKISSIGFALGVSYGLSYIIIGFLPLDLYQLAHNSFVIIACLLKVLAMSFFTLIILLDENYMNFFAYAYMVYFAIFYLFLIFLVLSNFDILVPFLPTCIIGQKLTFYFEAGLYIIQASGGIKHFTMLNSSLS